MLPEQGQSLKPPPGGLAEPRRYFAVASAGAWHLGCWILAAGCGSCPAPAATAGDAYAACRPAVAAFARPTILR